jgi:putative DNA primase/helicase
MTDEDVGAILVHMHALQMSKMSREMLAIAITYVAGGTRFHPVCDWLDSLRWDGVPRLDRWLNIVFGAEDSLGYHTKIGRIFLAAAVRRVRQPGIKFDYVLRPLPQAIRTRLHHPATADGLHRHHECR